MRVIERYGLKYEVDGETRELLAAASNDLVAHNGDAGWVLPAAATFVIAPGAAARYAHVSGESRERAEPADVLEVLADLAAAQPELDRVRFEP